MSCSAIEISTMPYCNPLVYNECLIPRHEPPLVSAVIGTRPAAPAISLPMEDEDPELRTKAVQALREWAEKQPHFVCPRTDDAFLLRFLRMRKFNLALAQQVLDKYMTLRKIFPHYYRKLDIEDQPLRDLMDSGYIFPLLEKDAHGRVVIFARTVQFDSRRGHRPKDLFRAYVMTFELLLEDEENQRRGFTYIFDEDGQCLREVIAIGVREMQKMVTCGEKGMPMRHKEMHFINLPSVIMSIYYLVAGLISSKLQKRLFIHSNLDSLYEHIPPQILPKEYGGTVPASVMAAEWVKALRANRQRLLNLDQMDVDDLKRPKTTQRTASRGFKEILCDFAKF